MLPAPIPLWPDIEQTEPGTPSLAPIAGDPDVSMPELRERLAYYERFDSLIADTVRRSADLFRTAYEERHRAVAIHPEGELEAALIEAARRSEEQREEIHLLLAELLEDAGQVQRQVDQLLERVADAVVRTAPRPGTPRSR